MKVWLRVGKIEVELKTSGPYSPDVVRDLCNRAGEAVIEQRCATALLEEVDSEPTS